MPEYTDNFHQQAFVLGGVNYYCAEQAFQALKFENPECQARKDILALDPTEPQFGIKCFRAGRAKDPSFRENWDGLKAEVMYRANRAKFAQNADSAAALLATGEANIQRPLDNDGFWSLWNCYIMKRIRIELKEPKDRSAEEEKLLETILGKFDLQATIFGGEDTIKSPEFDKISDLAKYPHE